MFGLPETGKNRGKVPARSRLRSTESRDNGSSVGSPVDRIDPLAKTIKGKKKKETNFA